MLKKILSLLVIGLISFNAKAQQPVPAGIAYQAVMRDNTGSVLSNTNIALSFAIYNSASAITPAYSETYTAINTGPIGIVTCTIGFSTNNNGSFAAVNWQGGDVYYQVFLDLGSGFSSIGPKQKFVTVPYAFYAEKAGNATPTPTLTINAPNTVTNTTTGNYNINISAPTLTLSGTALISGPSTNSVNLALLPYLWSSPSTTNVVLTNSVNAVGIGTNTPSHRLSVVESNTNAAIFGLNTNTLNTSVAGFFDGGAISKARPSSLYAFQAQSNTGASILGVYGNGNIGVNVLNPTNKLHVNSSNATAAIFAENIVSVNTASLAHGLKAEANSTHTMAAAVYAENIGTGASIYAIKTTSATNGIAGRFEIEHTSNGADVIFAKTLGTGTAIHAVCGPTVSGSSNLALEIEDGHIKTNSTVANPTFSLITTVSTLFSYVVNSTDVAGEVNIAMSPTTKPANQAYVKITFRKPYTVKPIVMLTPTTSVAGLVGAYVTATTSDFTIWFANGVSPTAAVTNYSFNYFVIEGK